MIYILPTDGIQEAELFPFQHLLTNDRKTKIKNYRFEKDRKAAFLVYLMLLYGLKTEYALEGKAEFVYGTYQKPILKNYPEIYFNLSHTDNTAVCGIDTSEIGVDTEKFQVQDKAFLTYICSRGELHEIETAQNPAATAAKLWTLKESYLKYLGTGLTEHLEQYDFSGASGTSFARYGCIFTICQGKNAYCSACAERTLSVRRLKITDFQIL